ncbi:sulfurtransferase [Rhodanobacter lindaniclasticus]|uniref:tRNA uridine(34) hydroxylase n=1 Tax=Rhodanobacter lindaniclasticus TaxID=75310 RepID=A0A4S3KH06_9GAMM|nr:sulfurtransferase [Rhodanobacter lindaniclasticus]THD07933.1 sulfurtransferase [Rhodanobacter lindaniclasticus]
MNVVNIAAYRFVALDDLPALRERVREHAEALALKGTVLLAPEGINLFLAGTRAATDAFMAWLGEDARLAGMEAKQSLSDTVPFGRLRVRLKREIITLRMPALRPAEGRAPGVDAGTLKRWLDQGRDDAGREVVMLDTRNDYETDAGAFAQAVDYRIARFTDFPAALAADRARYAGKTVVPYCTGGIRCEKAAIYMQELGIEHVHQLEGGILKYLELTDGAHWQGGCFVFDDRGAVDKQLLPLPPLPRGERVGVRGHAGDEADSQPASMDFLASTHPPSRPSPQGGEGAKATSAMSDRGHA